MHPRITSLRLSTVCLVLAVSCCLGCGSNGDRPPLGKVTGVVTIDGQPAAGLGVMFQPDGLRASIGMTDENGRYELTYLRDIKGAAVGTHTVKIDRVSQTEETPESPLPARYNSQTELTCEVERGKNEINFDLESE